MVEEAQREHKQESLSTEHEDQEDKIVNLTSSSEQQAKEVQAKRERLKSVIKILLKRGMRSDVIRKWLVKDHKEKLQRLKRLLSKENSMGQPMGQPKVIGDFIQREKANNGLVQNAADRAKAQKLMTRDLKYNGHHTFQREHNLFNNPVHGKVAAE